MNNRINFFFFENLIHCLFIQHIYIIKGNFLSCDLLYPLQCFLAGIIEIVHYDYIVTAV